MRLTVVSVAYPLAPVGPDAVGGAEQILSSLDRALAAAGHRSIVVACDGSQAEGALLSYPLPRGVLDERACEIVRERARAAVHTAVRRWRPDVVHMHGIDFHAYLPPPGPPVLATLHLPVSWYPPLALAPSRPRTYLQCVSRRQQAELQDNPRVVATIENGVSTDPCETPLAKRAFALVLSRICPEKGVHIAIDAAKRAGIALVIAGEVFSYPEHLRYFETEVRPRLDHRRRFIGPVQGLSKRRLLRAARCVLLPSLVAETSSLAAREALAAGTPVVGFARGALCDVIDHGRNGFLVANEDEMAAAIADCRALHPAEIQRDARARFSLRRMTAEYFALYRKLCAAPAAAIRGVA